MASLPLSHFDDFEEFDRRPRIPQNVAIAQVYQCEPDIEKLSYRARFAILIGLTVASWSVIGGAAYAIVATARLL